MSLNIKAIIGLGNPGPKFYHTRHNIGFRVLDALAEKHHASWHKKTDLEYAEIAVDHKSIILVKPQTFMNSSGRVIPFLQKQGIKPENILVVHDELEQPFGVLKTKLGGSAKGHNGLKSIIASCGDQFWRLRFGIGRPVLKEEVPDYVLQPFSENQTELEKLINESIVIIEQMVHG